jgi:hypothetical protein
MIPVWYLVLTAMYGGMMQIPQASREQCLANAAYLSSPPVVRITYSHLYPVCIPGVK